MLFPQSKATTTTYQLSSYFPNQPSWGGGGQICVSGTPFQTPFIQIQQQHQNEKYHMYKNLIVLLLLHISILEQIVVWYIKSLMQLVECGCLDLCAGFPWQPDREPFQGSSTEAASSLPNIFIQYYRKNILPLLRDYFHLSSELCKTIFPAFPKIFFLGAQLNYSTTQINVIVFVCFYFRL